MLTPDELLAMARKIEAGLVAKGDPHAGDDWEAMQVARAAIGFLTAAPPAGMSREDHLLCVLGEECAEVAQRVAKCLRFGRLEAQPGKPDNTDRLAAELNDLLAAITHLERAGVLPAYWRNGEAQAAKLRKVDEMLGYSDACGRLLDSPARAAGEAGDSAPVTEAALRALARPEYVEWGKTGNDRMPFTVAVLVRGAWFKIPIPKGMTVGGLRGILAAYSTANAPQKSEPPGPAPEPAGDAPAPVRRPKGDRPQ